VVPKIRGGGNRGRPAAPRMNAHDQTWDTRCRILVIMAAVRYRTWTASVHHYGVDAIPSHLDTGWHYGPGVRGGCRFAVRSYVPNVLESIRYTLCGTSCRTRLHATHRDCGGKFGQWISSESLARRRRTPCRFRVQEGQYHDHANDGGLNVSGLVSLRSAARGASTRRMGAIDVRRPVEDLSRRTAVGQLGRSGAAMVASGHRSQCTKRCCRNKIARDALGIEGARDVVSKLV